MALLYHHLVRSSKCLNVPNRPSNTVEQAIKSKHQIES